jgi:hypothetical protein
MSDHLPHPYGLVPDGGGVRCSCGAKFQIGTEHPWTRKGKRSKRMLKTMAHCWEQYRDHYGREVGHETQGTLGVTPGARKDRA